MTCCMSSRHSFPASASLVAFLILSPVNAVIPSIQRVFCLPWLLFPSTIPCNTSFSKLFPLTTCTKNLISHLCLINLHQQPVIVLIPISFSTQLLVFLSIQLTRITLLRLHISKLSILFLVTFLNTKVSEPYVVIGKTSALSNLNLVTIVMDFSF